MVERAVLTLGILLSIAFSNQGTTAQPAVQPHSLAVQAEDRQSDAPPTEVPVLPLRTVIQTIEQKTGFRFLYRDALVTGVAIRFAFNENWREWFESELLSAGITLVISEERKQIVLFQVRDDGETGVPVRSRELVGYVIDGQTGERLPFAAVIESQHRLGTQSDLQGRFRLDVPAGQDLQLHVSYVGYQASMITIPAGELAILDELPVRLEPAPFEGKEIVVHGQVLQQPNGPGYPIGLMMNGFSPLGESNTIRMLQTLPSVGMGTALSDGAFVRGSNSDALQVLLDGAVIYNKSHLFGLVDSFNADAIRTSSFYYDVTPARYQGPPGGTLNLVTRAGSLYRYRGNAGISSSALGGSMEGPLVPGRASVLVSGRTSLLNGYGFPGTGDLVAWGLNVGRPNSLDNGTTILEDRIVTPGDFKVNFHDLHGKIFLEDARGNRWMLSGYSGFNNTKQDALRLVRDRPLGPDAPLVRENFETRNRWGNRTASLGMHRALDPDRSMHLRSGVSYYHTRYNKEDFSYQRPGRNQQNQTLFIHPYENQSELTHWYLEADFIRYLPFGGGGDAAVEHTAEALPALLTSLSNLQSGLALHGYYAAYLEESLNRPRYYQRSEPMLLEGYFDTEWIPGGTETALPLELQAGMRLQYFSDGGYVRISPRLKAGLLPGARLSPSVGYSRTYQYLFKLAFYNQTTSDIWITANNNQEPATVDLWSASLHFRVTGGWFLRGEAYYKHQRNLRFHEINIQSIQSPLEGAPWFADNSGYARGVEFQAGYGGDRLSLIQSYTLSRTEMSNPRLNQGARFLAYWDRTHQFNTLFFLRPFSGLRVDVNWFFATGVPDRLGLFRSGDTRLGNYSRIDLSLKYDANSGFHRWSIEAGVYNLTNRQNPWYRDWVLTVDEETQQRRLEPVQVVFYDLGFQPSFSLRYYLDP